ncbi:MAG TPA: FIST N-terminal domain-containing protein [Acetobacteraceae bacterium]|nr:FIST N-terminal domain-containing protein [Acetobacteraceae bacterium]
MLLVFCGGKHDPQPVLGALRASFGDVPLVGGSAAGAIWNHGCGYSGLEVGIAAFLHDSVVPEIRLTTDLDRDEVAAGKALGRSVAETAAENAVVLLFFDSVARNPPLRLHFASSIVEGFQEGLGSHPVTLIGGGLLTDLNLSDGWVFDGAGIRKHAAIALVFPPRVHAETVVLHGCRPVSTFMEITRIEGAEVFELDGQPALAAIKEKLPHLELTEENSNLSLIATLGEKQGDPFAPYDENAYVNRLILNYDRTRGSVTLFEPDFRRGTRVQIMSRDNSLMLDSARNGVKVINDAARARDCLMGLYIDCAGRASARSGAPVEEADLVRQGFEPSVPLLGFYSGVEVAPFQGYSRPLDWTGVLTVLRRRP